MTEISTRQLVLLMVGIDEFGAPKDFVSGITRLQKYLFLLEKDGEFQSIGDPFEFQPYDAGPFSSRLYDDLEVLENLGLIASEVTAEATEEEEPELDRLSFGDLINDESDRAADAFQERRFFLTERGLDRISRLLETGEYAPVIAGIRRVKSSFSHYSLKDLLHYVYTRYPEMTTESKIKDEVLKRRRHQ